VCHTLATLLALWGVGRQVATCLIDTTEGIV
jgi:endonuclease III